MLRHLKELALRRAACHSWCKLDSLKPSPQGRAVMFTDLPCESAELLSDAKQTT